MPHPNDRPLLAAAVDGAELAARVLEAFLESDTQADAERIAKISEIVDDYAAGRIPRESLTPDQARVLHPEQSTPAALDPARTLVGALLIPGAIDEVVRRAKVYAAALLEVEVESVAISGLTTLGPTVTFEVVCEGGSVETVQALAIVLWCDDDAQIRMGASMHGLTVKAAS